MADIRTYRNKLNGLVGAFPREFGDIFKDVLEEVEEGVSAIATEVTETSADPNSIESAADAAPTERTEQ